MSSINLKTSSYNFIYYYEIREHEIIQLTIDDKGVMTGFIQYSQPGYPVRELGTFYVNPGIEDQQLIQLGRVIYENGLHSGESFSTDLWYGKKYKIFIIEVEDQEITHFSGVEEPLPESLVQVEDLVLKLFDRLVEAPQRTLGIEFSLRPNSITPGEDLRIDLEFRNRGPFTTEFRNPANFTAGDTNILNINFWTRRVSENGKPYDHYSWSLDLVGREFLVSENKAIPSHKPYLTIAPNSTFSAWTVVRFPKTEPGLCYAELVYYATPASDEEKEKRDDLIVGEYHADPVQLSVLKR